MLSASKFNLVSLTFLCFFFTSGSSLLKGDVKESVDQALRYLKTHQNLEGSYGSSQDRYRVTSLVLLAFTTSPRNYSDQDGPFIRKAADWLVAQQNTEGLISGPEDPNPFHTTALALSALASVPNTQRTPCLEKGFSALLQYMTSQGPSMAQTPCFFHGLLALKFMGFQNFHKITPLETESASLKNPNIIFQMVGTILRGEELPKAFKTQTLIHEIENKLSRPAKSEAHGQEVDHIWAGIFLLNLLEAQGNAPEGWADRLSKPLTETLGTLIQNQKQEGLKSIATLTCALSLCYGNLSEQIPHGGEGGPDLPDFVEKPLSLQEALSKGLDFFSHNQNEGKFGFHGYPDPGITALVLSATQRTTRRLGQAQPEFVLKGLEYLKGLQKENGSIYQDGLANYVTSASIMAFKDSGLTEYESVMAAAKDFLVLLQADEGEGYSMEHDPYYGGLGYGSDERPDLSNTQMSIEALREAGLSEDHQAFKKAILFLQKCQNLSETNPTKVKVSLNQEVIAGNDGGGFYSPGSSKADLDEIAKGVFVARSYGSMTYALLKSYLLAGLVPEDPRVQAAVKWIKKNYSIDENPGFKKIPGLDLGQQGLYYYYLTMARALNALNIDTIETLDGERHVWRQELETKLLGLQRLDGSWINDRSPRWFEGNPVLATAYALLVLDACQKK